MHVGQKLDGEYIFIYCYFASLFQWKTIKVNKVYIISVVELVFFFLYAYYASSNLNLTP